MVAEIARAFESIVPHLSGALASAETISIFRSIVEMFRGEALGAIGFETRLCEEDGRADFGLSIPRVEETDSAGLFARFNLPDGAHENEVWKRVQHFMDQWSQPGSILRESVEAICFEFDLDQCRQAIPLPGVFLYNRKEGWANESVLKVIRAAAKSLRGKSMPDGMESNLRRCLESFPDTAYAETIGVMMPRSSDVIHLHVGGLDPQEMIRYLAAIGWAGTTETAQRFLEEAFRLLDLFVLTLEVGSTINKKVGFECFYSHGRPYVDYPPGSQWFQAMDYLAQPQEMSFAEYQTCYRWTPFLDYLVSKGLCLETKRDALVDWIGVSRISTNGETESRIRRYVNHIKVVCSAEGELTAKAYAVASR